MKFVLTILGTLSIASSALAGAAFSERTMCSLLKGGSGTQLSAEVINSLPDGYSHRITLTVNNKTQVIASFESGDNSAMDRYYHGSFPVVIDGKKGSLTFDGDAYINTENGLNADKTVRKATLKIQGQKSKTLLCITIEPTVCS